MKYIILIILALLIADAGTYYLSTERKQVSLSYISIYKLYSKIRNINPSKWKEEKFLEYSVSIKSHTIRLGKYKLYFDGSIIRTSLLQTFMFGSLYNDIEDHYNPGKINVKKSMKKVLE